MKAVRTLSAYRLHRAIIQAVGELEQLGQTIRVSDVALFLGCSKPTAQYHLKRMQMLSFVTLHAHKYRANTHVYTIELTDTGRKQFNSQVAIEAKLSVYAMRGVLK